MAELGGRQDADPHLRHEDAVAQPEAAAIVRTDAGVVTVSVSREIYSRRVVLAAAYKLSNRWATLVDEDGPGRWRLYLIGLTPEDASGGLTFLVQELTDQALRERLDEETRDLRTLIVAQAFAEGNLLDPDRDRDHDLPDARDAG